MLENSARSWAVVAITGQLIFATYVSVVYGKALAAGNMKGWNVAMPRGYVEGDTSGNITLGLHLLFAVVMLAGGAAQLAPWIRNRYPQFYRWNGRLYLGAAALMGVGGLYLLWVRGTVGGLGQHLGTTLNAVLLLLCAAMTLRHAIARRFRDHQRWALRLFLVTGGVWCFRISLMLILMIYRRPVGFDLKAFDGPLLTFLSFAQTLIPLAILELYLWARDRGTAMGKMAVAGLLIVLTLATAGGVAAATLGMWLPRM